MTANLKQFFGARIDSYAKRFALMTGAAALCYLISRSLADVVWTVPGWINLITVIAVFAAHTASELRTVGSALIPATAVTIILGLAGVPETTQVAVVAGLGAAFAAVRAHFVGRAKEPTGRVEGVWLRLPDGREIPAVIDRGPCLNDECPEREHRYTFPTGGTFELPVGKGNGVGILTPPPHKGVVAVPYVAVTTEGRPVALSREHAYRFADGGM